MKGKACKHISAVAVAAIAALLPGREPQAAFRTERGGNQNSGSYRHGGNGRGASLSDTANQVSALFFVFYWKS